MRSARALLVVLCGVLVIGGCDWLQLGFDSGMSGVQPVETTLTPQVVPHLHPLFAVKLGDSNLSAGPVVGFGAVFAISCSGTTCAVTRRDPRSGVLAWSTNIGSGSGSAVLATHSVVVATAGGVAAFDPATGAPQWSHPTAATVFQLLVDHDRIFTVEAVRQTVTSPASIEVFDALDGHRLWSVAQGTWFGDHILVVANGVVYANRNVGQTFDGVDEYEAATGTAVRHGVGCHVGVFVRGVLYSDASACNPTTGTIMWSHAGVDESAEPAVADQLVMPSIDAKGHAQVSAYNANNGAHLWDRSAGPAGSTVNTQPTIAGGVVYVGSAQFGKTGYTRMLNAYRLSNGRRLASITVPGAAGLQESPAVVVAGGVVYFQAAGVLYAFTA